MALFHPRQPCLRHPEFGGELPLRLPTLTPRLSNEMSQVLRAANCLILAHMGTKNDISSDVNSNDISSNVRVNDIRMGIKVNDIMTDVRTEK